MFVCPHRFKVCVYSISVFNCKGSLHCCPRGEWDLERSDMGRERQDESDILPKEWTEAGHAANVDWKVPS